MKNYLLYAEEEYGELYFIIGLYSTIELALAEMERCRVEFTYMYYTVKTMQLDEADRFVQVDLIHKKRNPITKEWEVFE